MRWLAIFLVLVVGFVATTGCIFRPTPFRGVTGYRDGRVFFKPKDFYAVGPLPSSWQRMRMKARTVSFYHDEWGASITTEAFCGRAIVDVRMESLAGELMTALDDRRVIKEERLEVDGREGLRRKVRGTMDGVRVAVDAVVIRKHGCAFDFYAVTPGDFSPEVSADFERFFTGFHYG